jgi:hypothetical protein
VRGTGAQELLGAADAVDHRQPRQHALDVGVARAEALERAAEVRVGALLASVAQHAAEVGLGEEIELAVGGERRATRRRPATR